MSLWKGVELHAVIDTVPDAMVIADEEGRIRSFSKGAEKMFGYCEAEVLGKNIALLMPSPDRERRGGYMRRNQETQIPQIIGIGRVTTARSSDGTTFPINLSLSEIKVDGTSGYVAFIRDLTESRETERELHTLQSELAHVSRISSIGGMATSLAHELNQPLTAVTNYANSASDLLKDPSEENLALVREALDECAQEALRAGQIVHRLRDFISRGETERHIVSLSRLVKEASALALMNGDGKKVDFETVLDPDLDEVLVDPVQIQQVVLNLIRNALEAMLESPHKRLIISSWPGKPGFVELIVADSGPGLEPHIADRLFHPFNTSKESGMGLGLSICHTIITAHGGKIAAKPSELGGTAFHITLPLASQGDDDG
ncbi:PAS domain S-box protein [Erythrobacter insulae]|uniref:Sensor protein FixL n=1 Tax=Erythrobacter insulae TaxID=2584124 RepID=A0A547PBW8_9SPHN|nr:PAS domain S-box protein [Erythrobacter insulae]TRD11638.1 PAS domain S-box protein [Erythrobacter insulae]